MQPGDQFFLALMQPTANTGVGGACVGMGRKAEAWGRGTCAGTCVGGACMRNARGAGICRGSTLSPPPGAQDHFFFFEKTLFLNPFLEPSVTLCDCPPGMGTGVHRAQRQGLQRGLQLHPPPRIPTSTQPPQCPPKHRIPYPTSPPPTPRQASAHIGPRLLKAVFGFSGPGTCSRAQDIACCTFCQRQSSQEVAMPVSAHALLHRPAGATPGQKLPRPRQDSEANERQKSITCIGASIAPQQTVRHSVCSHFLGKSHLSRQWEAFRDFTATQMSPTWESCPPKRWSL